MNILPLAKRQYASNGAMRADKLLDAGDMDGRAVWLKILRALKELLATTPPHNSKVH